MQIIEFGKKYTIEVKNLMVELQEYIVSLDKNKLNIITPEYKDKYFTKTFKQLKANSGKMYIAIEDDKVVGLVCGYLASYDKWDRYDYTCPKKGVISELIVSKLARGGGVGKKLMTTIESYFKSLNCEYVILDVFAPNVNGNAFYDSLDYKDVLITKIKKM